MKVQRDEKKIWRCSRYNTMKCRSTVTTHGEVVVLIKNEHNHPPPSPVFNRSLSGAPILILNGYRFGYHIKSGLKTRWRCGSARHKKCKAHVYTVDDIIVKCQTEHNHDPPKTYSNF
ncbi:hypothetical protein KGM_208264 [Danaus plexippus plexippus]|uniref:FLYWCH-type domain-containing protein n=1 Tax=Danaus plexippus plexippus TaxID=278856 RepID=A0A212EXQ6_DANPL|nr:hypothetical protein KGM_208264 [Danaus plexippus plexippus]